jgi:hypothetical protein
MSSTSLYASILRLEALAIAAAGAAHVFWGVAAERLLDPSLPVAIETLPSLDSQNRFYGAMFSVVSALLWQAAGDLARYRPLVNTLLVGFMCAGLTRLLSVLKLGWPAPVVVGFLTIEVLMPPCMLLWGARLSRGE